MPSNPMQQMWMGPRGNEQWMKAPDAGGTFTPIGYTGNSGGTQQLGGGFNVRRSKTSHMDYPMSWSFLTRLGFQPLRDMYSGARGPGLIYLVDLAAADLNLMPEAWAFPASACYDARPIIGPTSSLVRPSNVATPTNLNSYPPETAQYAIPTSGVTTRSLYIPIAPGFTLWFGVQGTISGTGGLRVTPILLGNTATTPVFPTMLAVTGTMLVNVSYSSATYQGIVIDIDNSGSAATINLSAMHAQMLPTGASPVPGSFVGGYGNSGCDFVEAPIMVVQNTYRDYVTGSAHLAEVGDWQ